MSISHSRRKPPERTGPELIKEIVTNADTVTLDRVLNHSPFANPLDDPALEQLVKTLRLERAQIDVKKETRKEKRRDAKDDSN